VHACSSAPFGKLVNASIIVINGCGGSNPRASTFTVVLFMSYFSQISLSCALTRINPWAWRASSQKLIQVKPVHASSR